MGDSSSGALIQIYYYLRAKLFDWVEQRRVERAFYHNAAFKALDLALRSLYEDQSPYAISKEFLQVRGEENVFAYGETPLTTVQQMVTQFGLGPGHRLIELGAGRGRAALFLASYHGLRVDAIEQIPIFVDRLNSLNVPNLRGLCGDMTQADFRGATHVYLYGTMLTEGEILNLIDRFPKAAKIISVSYPLTDYSDEYRVEQSLMGKFPWGKTKVYLNERSG